MSCENVSEQTSQWVPRVDEGPIAALRVGF